MTSRHIANMYASHCAFVLYFMHLSFTSRGVIRQLQELRKDLKPILNLVGNCNSEKRKEVLSLLERLRFLLNVYAESQENDAKDEEGHIMISFSWQQQSIVKVFVERLRRKGYSFWLTLIICRGYSRGNIRSCRNLQGNYHVRIKNVYKITQLHVR